MLTLFGPAQPLRPQERMSTGNMSDSQWIKTNKVSALTINTLHIWRLRLHLDLTNINDLWQMLSKDEQQRAQRFVRPQDQAKFVQVRGHLRMLLGQYLNVRGETLAFEYGEYGKPQLTVPCNALNLQFNVSHSHDLALIAITQAVAVGVDLEQVNSAANYIDISDRFFTPAEHQVLLQHPQTQQCQAFFRLWTRKEACIKALGGSIAHALDQIAVAQGLDQPITEIKVIEPSQPGQLFLQNLSLGSRYAGAVATPQPLPYLYTWEWQAPQ